MYFYGEGRKITILLNEKKKKKILFEAMHMLIPSHELILIVRPHELLYTHTPSAPQTVFCFHVVRLYVRSYEQIISLWLIRILSLSTNYWFKQINSAYRLDVLKRLAVMLSLINRSVCVCMCVCVFCLYANNVFMIKTYCKYNDWVHYARHCRFRIANTNAALICSNEWIIRMD